MAYFPLEIPLYPHMRDHAFDGRVMFSAAELLSLMAAQVALQFPGLENAAQTDALFPRFLLLPPEEERRVSVLLELETEDERGISAKLLRRFQSRSGALARLREHVRVRFRKEKNSTDVFTTSFDTDSELSGDLFEIPAERIYAELVPFGPAYRNIRGSLRLNPQGVVARLSTGGNPLPDSYSRLFPGTPLIADAAFHAACVWGQRYSGKVVFPLGFHRRLFFRKFQHEGAYLCRVLPVDTAGETLVFDLRIYSQEGSLCEAVLGLRMADVSAGRIKPPAWVQEGTT